MLLWSLILSVVLVVVSLASLVIWTGTEDFQRRVRPVVAALLAHQTGELASVERVEVAFSRPAVTLRGLRLLDRDTHDPIVEVARVEAPVVLRDGGLKLGRLGIDAPHITVVLDEKGKLTHFEDRVRGDKPLQRLPWDSIAVSGGTLSVRHPKGTIDITELNATPEEPPDLDRSGPVLPFDPHRTDVHAKARLTFTDKVDETLDIDLPDVTIGPERIHIPAIALTSLFGTIDGLATIPLQGELDVDLTVHPELPEINRLLPAPYALHGSADTDLHLGGLAADPVLESVVLWRDIKVDLPGKLWPVITYSFGDLTGVVKATRDGASIEQALIRWADGEVRASGFIEPSGTVQRLDVVAEDISLAEALRVMQAAPHPWVDFKGDAELHLTGTVKPLLLEGPFDLSVADLLVKSGPVDTAANTQLDLDASQARGRLVVDKDHVVIYADQIVGPRSRGRAVVDIGTKPQGPLDLWVDLYEADLSDFRPLGNAELFGTGTLRARFRGPFKNIEMEGEGDLRDFSVAGIHYADHLVSPMRSDLKVLELTDARARLGSSRYGGTLTLDFRDPFSLSTDVTFTRARVEDITGAFADLGDLTGDLTGTLTLDGPFNDMNGAADFQLGDLNLWGEHFLAGEAHGEMNDGLFTLDDLRVTRAGGAEGILVRGSVGRAWSLNMEVVGDGFELSRLDSLEALNLPLTGQAGFYARVGNTLKEPEPHGRVSLWGVRYAGHPVEPSVVRFQTADGVLDYSGEVLGSAAAVKGTLGLWGEQPYTLHADLTQFPAHTLYPVAADGRRVEAVVDGELVASGTFGEEASPVDLTGTFESVTARWGRHTLTNPHPWKYTQNGALFELEDFTLQGGSTNIDLDASNLFGSLRASGTASLDLDLLRAVVPDLTRSEGIADVKVSARGGGSSVDALIDATATWDLLEHASFPGLFEDLTAEVLATHDRYNLLDVRGSLGGGEVSGRGRILADRWRPTRFELEGQANDAQLQWVDWLPPAIGDATFTFDGPVDQLLLSGDVTVSDMTWSDRMNWEDWVVELRENMLVARTDTNTEPLFAIDVDLTADRTIVFDNNLVEGVASADLHILGDTVRSGLLGSVQIEEGVAFLQDREFKVDRGDITWRDPWTWDPDLDLDLETDITSRDRRYRVNYRVLGPYSNWRAETRSDPQLSQADLNALLWFGVTAADLEGMGDLYSAIGQSVADVVLGDLLATNQLGGEDVRNLVDVDIATGVNTRGEYSPDPRLVLERRFDDLGNTDLRWELNMVRTQDWTLRVDNRLSEDLSLSAWYASQQRNSGGTGRGAVGADVRVRKEWD